MPGSVQHDLWQAGEIPDPYFERNSLLIEWTAARSWVYKRSFQANPAWRDQRVRLRFKGVDYHARFFLNGKALGEHHSMYTPAVFEISDDLTWGADNLLAVAIDEAPHEQPQVGYTSRVRTHKARMNYWWDFSPRMVHQGIWDGVDVLVSGPAAIEDVWVRPQLEPGYEAARVTTAVDISVREAAQVEVELNILSEGCPSAQWSEVRRLQPGVTRVPLEVRLEQPCLWWPNGYGPQPLYEAEVTVRTLTPDGKVVSDVRRVRFGIRELAFQPNEGAAPNARPYTLTVNGQRVYTKGWNWVPMDVLYGVERPERLAHLLSLARDANVNLLRVWGGGLIEREAFYALCDRYGILVWQEFIQSSSGVDNIPTEDPEWVAHMAEEARRIVPLRRNHPSLAVWCGGNELQKGMEQPLDEQHLMLSALHQVVQEEAPDTLWLPTSSSGPVFSNSLKLVAEDATSLHDVHGPWEYQGLRAQYDLYNNTTSLFHSEFGAEGLTNQAALDTVIAPEHQWPVTLDNPLYTHLAAWWVKAPLWQAAYGEIPNGDPQTGVRNLLRATQFTQFEGVRYAIESNRRRSFHNSGSIPWQFNEPYPMAACTSAVDYYGEPKPIYYGVRNAYRPVAVTARYETLAWADCSNFEAEIWITPSEYTPLENARLTWRLVGMDGKIYAAQSLAANVRDEHPRAAAAVRLPIDQISSELFFLDLRLEDTAGELIAENRYLFTTAADLQPIFHLPQGQVEAQAQKNNDHWQVTLRNPGEQAALYVQMRAERDLRQAAWANFDANYFTLLPGETRTVRVRWENMPAAQRELTLWGWNVPQQTI